MEIEFKPEIGMNGLEQRLNETKTAFLLQSSLEIVGAQAFSEIKRADKDFFVAP